MNILLYTLINNVFNLLQMPIMVRVVLSWVPHNPYSQLIQLLYQVTEPILRPIKETLPVQSAGIDFFSIVAFFLQGFAKKILLMAV